MRIRTSKSLAVLIVSFFCIYGNATAGSYKIELLIFSQNIPTSEVFDRSDSSINWPNRVVSLSAYKNVSTQHLNLRHSYTKLASVQNYRPLMHVAWIQSIGSNRLGNAVQIKNPEGTINGFFRIRRGNLLHMIADIEYSRGSVIYRLNEKRRFKLNETHYLDHPKFGILARISPL